MKIKQMKSIISLIQSLTDTTDLVVASKATLGEGVTAQFSGLNGRSPSVVFHHIGDHAAPLAFAKFTRTLEVYPTDAAPIEAVEIPAAMLRPIFERVNETQVIHVPQPKGALVSVLIHDAERINLYPVWNPETEEAELAYARPEEATNWDEAAARFLMAQYLRDRGEDAAIPHVQVCELDGETFLALKDYWGNDRVRLYVEHTGCFLEPETVEADAAVASQI